MKKNLISIFVLLFFFSNIFPMSNAFIKVNPRLPFYKETFFKTFLKGDVDLFSRIFNLYERYGYASAQDLIYSLRNEDGETLLHSAIYLKYIDIFKLILSHNVDINGNSELYKAIESDIKEEIISLLIKGVDPNGLTDKHGFTVFDVACQCSKARLANDICDQYKGRQEAPILFAARYGYLNSFNVLLNFNSTNIGARNVNGSSILHLLVFPYKNKKSLPIISAFEDCLKKGFNINDMDKKGRTPLDYSQNNFHMNGEENRAFTKLVSFFLASKGAKTGDELKEEEKLKQKELEIIKELKK